MTADRTAFLGAPIFDGNRRFDRHALIVADGRVAAIQPERDLAPCVPVIRLDGGVICPGLVDLQVNGGGGVMVNDAPSVDTLRRISRAHARLGTTSILPTLITDRHEMTQAAIHAVAEAIAADVPGLLGLHLEGPHLSRVRKGAHDAALIRPMEQADMDMLLAAATRLPILKVTLAPETVSPEQIARLADAGILVSLGHSDADLDTCAAAARSGARCVTHLFNAMSQLGSREPGLVGAALSHGALSAGLIADGHHVHPESIGLALRAKVGPGRIFLVSDAMSVAGTSAEGFSLGGRKVLRRGGRLALEDGTLAGADLDLLGAVRNLIRWGVADLETALSMASSIPAQLVGARAGTLHPGAPADILHLDPTGDKPARVWRAGHEIT